MEGGGLNDSPEIEEGLLDCELIVDAGVSDKVSRLAVVDEMDDFCFMLLALLGGSTGVATDTTFMPIELPVDAGMNKDVTFFFLMTVR